MTDKTKEPRTLGYFGRLLEEIRARNLPVPAALVGEARPLGLSTRQDLPAWCARRGYDDEAIRLLNSAIGVHVRSTSYQLALASDLGERVDLDGAAAGSVSEMDRHSAALRLFVRERKDAAKRGAEPPSPAPSPYTAPSAPEPAKPMTTPSSPAAGPPKRPIIGLRLGALSIEELERRRRAFAGVEK